MKKAIIKTWNFVLTIIVVVFAILGTEFCHTLYKMAKDEAETKTGVAFNMDNKLGEKLGMTKTYFGNASHTSYVKYTYRVDGTYRMSIGMLGHEIEIPIDVTYEA